MRRIPLLLAVAALVAGVAFAGTGGAAAPAEDPLVAILSPADGSGTSIARLDPATLKASARAEIGEYHGTWSLAPDESRRVAVGLSAPGKKGRVGIRIFDIDSLRVLRDIETGIYGAALAWVSPRRLVAALGSGSVSVRDPKTGKFRSRTIGGDVAVVDPQTGAILHRRSLGASTLDGVFAATPRGLVALLPRAGVARLVLAGPDGRVRGVTLYRTPLRLRHRPRGGSMRERAGLAVDPAGDRAYVIGAGSHVAEVNLETMRADYHAVTGGGAVFKRPAGRAPLRYARWLGDGRVAVWGGDLSLSARPVQTAAGVAMLDTARWTARLVDERASRVALANDRLLVGGRGVRGYDLDGRRRFNVLGTVKLDGLLVAGSRAYAINLDTVRVLDAATGRLLAGPLTDLGLRDFVAG